MVPKGLEGALGVWRQAKRWGSGIDGMSWEVSSTSVSVRWRNLTLSKVMGIVGIRILVWGGGTTGEQRTDPPQPHLKPVTQPRGSGGLAATVLKLLLKHLPAQPCVKRCRFGLQPVPLICLYLFGIPEKREKVYGKQKLPGLSSAVLGIVLSWPHPCCHPAM